MSNPYFSVGEEVIVIGSRFSDYDGDQVVEIIHSGSRGSFSYTLEGIRKDRLLWDGTFYQSSLRKKHKPSTDSFTEMMGNIKELVTQ